VTVSDSVSGPTTLDDHHPIPSHRSPLPSHRSPLPSYRCLPVAPMPARRADARNLPPSLSPRSPGRAVPYRRAGGLTPADESLLPSITRSRRPTAGQPRPTITSISTPVPPIPPALTTVHPFIASTPTTRRSRRERLPACDLVVFAGVRRPPSQFERTVRGPGSSIGVLGRNRGNPILVGPPSAVEDAPDPPARTLRERRRHDPSRGPVRSPRRYRAPRPEPVHPALCVVFRQVTITAPASCFGKRRPGTAVNVSSGP